MVSEVQAKSSELRAFDSISSRGFLLYKQPYQESDLIVEVLIEHGLRLSALVRGGQRSVKRFGGRLEALQLLQCQLRAPRGTVSYESMFSLEAVEVLEIYSGYRGTWDALNEGLYYTELIRDLFPKGEQEAWIFSACLKTFSIANDLALDRGGTAWRKVYVWSHFANRLGYGVLGERGLFNSLLAEDFPEWQKTIAAPIFSEEAVRFLSRISENNLDKKILRDLYSDWMQRSHIKCRALELLVS